MKEHADHKHTPTKSESRFDLYKIGKWGAIAIIVYFLWAEHRAHVIQYLPYLLLLACPLIHIFMHGDHAGHGGHNQSQENESSTFPAIKKESR